jgi:hypothetical protein
MCSYQNLAQSSNGYIIKCPECNSLQLAFGTTVVSMQADEYNELSRVVALEYKLRHSYEDNRAKQISIALTESIAICLTKDELEILQEMFCQSAALMETYSLIEAL